MKNITLRNLIVAFLLLLISGCYNTPQQSADGARAQEAEEALEEAYRQVPQPNIVNWNELRLFKATMERRDQTSLATWTYTKNMDGKYTFICESMGYGIPYNVRANNPMHYEYVTTRTGARSPSITGNGSCNGLNGFWDGKACIWGDHQLLPQAEPNGLHVPESAHGTWVTCRHPETGKPSISLQQEDVAFFEYRLPDAMVEGFHPAPLPSVKKQEVEQFLPVIKPETKQQ